MNSSTTILYNTYTLSELNWVKEHTPGIYKISVSVFSESNYVHPAIDNIELIRYNYTKNSVLSNMSLNAFFILNDYMYINFGTVDPTNSSSILQMGKSADQTITLTNTINKLEIYSSTDNDILVKDSSGNTISRSNNSRKPYYNVWIIDTSLLPSSTITIQNCGVSTATVSYDDGTGSSSVTDVTMNGSTVVVDGVAELSDDNLGLKQFITSVTSLIPENELTENELHKTYLLTEFDSTQPQFVVGDLYTVVEVYDSVDPSTVVGYKYKTVGKTSIPVGNVSNIRYTMSSGVLKLGWKDPDDLVIHGTIVSKWAKTLVRYNSYAEDYSGEMSFPATPEDGVELITTTTRNQYNVEPKTFDNLSPNTIYYIRFFPCNESGVYTIETPSPNDNRCSTNNISWSLLNDYLENFGTQSSYLPKEGGAINVKYLLSDRYGPNNTGVYTRDEVLAQLDAGTMTPVNTDWIVIGYNKTVPRYVKYRKFDSELGSYNYVFVSSLDDSATSTQFRLLDGSTQTRNIVTGTLCERPIVVGCRVFTRNYDEQETEWDYEDSGNTVLSVSNETFTYGDGAFAYTVPTEITVDGDVYEFCSYTMTLQPRCCLGSIGYGNNNLQTTMQWNASSQNSATVGQDKFPTISEFSADQGYYYENNGEYVAIDVSNGFSDTMINEYPKDVYVIDDFGKLKLATAKYMPGLLKKSIDGTNPTGNIAGHTYQKTVGGTTTTLTSCYEWEANRDYVVNMYVHYNQVIYKVTTETPLTSTTPPDQDSSHYTIQIDLSIQTDTTPEGNGYCIYGEKIPVNPNMTILEYRLDTNRNLYDGSWYRFWINDKYGFSDNKWKKFLPYDVRSTSGIAQSNGLRLKLAAEKDLLKQIIPAINPTYIYGNWVPYSSNWEWKNSHYTWYPTDYFFPISMYEVSLWNDGDGTAKFTGTEEYPVYVDNTSRIKWAMKADGTINQTSTTSGVIWWLRSPHPSYAGLEYFVASSGGSYNYTANTSYGVAPACVIG